MTDEQQDKPKRRILNPINRAYAEKRLLPSFGISVSRSDPLTEAIPAEWGTEDFSVDSGDAFSVSHLQEDLGRFYHEPGFRASGPRLPQKNIALRPL
jgi:hypothetical protein